MNIPYVEDDDDPRQGVSELLQDGARQVVGCASATQALAQFETEAFDVVITGVALPRVTGIKLARTLLSDQQMLDALHHKSF
ncbi:MAG: response regulator [Rubrivivax sp.]